VCVGLCLRMEELTSRYLQALENSESPPRWSFCIFGRMGDVLPNGIATQDWKLAHFEEVGRDREGGRMVGAEGNLLGGRKA
jgi:hypothetical protein